MAKNNFDSKENLGHGIKGEMDTYTDANADSKNLKSEKSNKKSKNK